MKNSTIFSQLLTIFSFSFFTEKWSAHFTNISVLASESSVSIGGLQPTTAYQVRLFAVNSLGRSEPSDVVSVLTAEETPGGPPLHIKTMPLSSTSVKVRVLNCVNVILKNIF